MKGIKGNKVLLLVAILVLSATIIFAAEQLTIYEWWTAGGELQAITKAFQMFNEAYPNIKIIPNPIVGGGGATLQMVLTGLLAAGMPPDTFQSLGGSSLKLYVDGGYLMPVDDIWTKENLDNVFPKMLKEMVTFNGHQYGIPMDIHRANWLFYNTKIFDQLGLTPPTNIDELINTCATIKKQRPDLWPITLGTRDKFTAVFLFDDVLLDVAGPTVYEKYYTGQLDVQNDPNIRKAFEYYAKLVPYIYPYHGSQTWDQALGRKDWVMMAIGDFAAGYMLATGQKYGVDWDALAIPNNVFLMIVDTFTRPKNAKDPNSTNDWLEFITQPLLEQQFSILKGSIAPNNKVDPSTYLTPIQQEDAKDFNNPNITIVPSSIHGSLAPTNFLSDYQDVLVNFLYSPDVNRVLSQISNIMKIYNVKDASQWFWSMQ